MFKSTSIQLQGPSLLIVTPLFDAGLWLLLGRWRAGITGVSRSWERRGGPGVQVTGLHWTGVQVIGLVTECWASRRNGHEEGVRAKEGEGVSRSGLNSPGTLQVSNSKTSKDFEQHWPSAKPLQNTSAHISSRRQTSLFPLSCPTPPAADRPQTHPLTTCWFPLMSDSGPLPSPSQQPRYPLAPISLLLNGRQ